MPSIDSQSRLLTVDKPNQLIRLGLAADLARCKATFSSRADGPSAATRVCNRAIHSSKSLYVTAALGCALRRCVLRLRRCLRCFHLLRLRRLRRLRRLSCCLACDAGR